MGIAGYNKTVSSSKAVAPTLNLSGLFENSYNKTVTYQGTVSAPDEDIGIDLDDYMDIDVTYESQELPWWQNGLNLVGKAVTDVGKLYLGAKATVAVATTSVLSGVLDVGEGILDGATWLVAGGANLLGFNDAATSMRAFIAEDQVGNLNRFLYEETAIGQVVNGLSFMKYDSSVAKGIRTVTETGTTFVAATAATVLTGGAASVALPLTLGFLSGSGKKAETVYNKSEASTTGGQEAQIFLSGVGGAASWYFQGKAGKKAWDAYQSGALQVTFSKTKTAGQTAFRNAGTKLQTTYNTVKSSFQTNGAVETMKKGAQATWDFTKSKATQAASTIRSTWRDTLMKSVTDASSNIDFTTKKAGEFASGERELTLNAVGAVAAEWIFDRAGAMLSKSEKNVIYDIADDIDDGLTREATHQLREDLVNDTKLLSKVKKSATSYIDSQIGSTETTGESEEGLTQSSEEVAVNYPEYSSRTRNHVETGIDLEDLENVLMI